MNENVYNGWKKNYIPDFGWIWIKNDIIVTEVRLKHKNIKFLEFPYLPVDKIQEICNEITLEKAQIKYSSE